MEWLEIGGLLLVGMMLAVGGWGLGARRTRDAPLESDVQEMEESLDCIRALLTALPNFVFLLDSDGVRALNAAAQQAWGVSQDTRLTTEDIGASPRDAASLDKLLVGEGVQRTRVRLRDASGRGFPCELVAVPAVLKGVEVVIADARDVGEREEMEQRIRLADRLGATGTLAAGIAHEINNPLTYIASNIAYVRDHLPPGEEELVEALDDSSAGVARITAIVQEMRQFSGVDDVGGTTPLVRPMRFALRLTKHVLRHNCDVVTRFDDDLPEVIGDNGRLSQVFVNLLTNAAESMPSGRSAGANRVLIDARVTPTHVEVTVQDNGCGMSAEQLEHMFDPFGGFNGGGEAQLGLSISHGIVEQLGGELAVESKSGIGTTVSVKLRRSKPAVRSVRQPTPTAQTSGGQRVLLIDDEPNVLRGMRRVLAREYEVVTAASGAEAVDLLSKGEEFDAVLCDMMMPKMTGSEVLAWLEVHRPDIARRFAIVTGGAVGGEQEKFLESAAVPVVRKPLTRVELFSVIDLLSSRLR